MLHMHEVILDINLVLHCLVSRRGSRVEVVICLHRAEQSSLQLQCLPITYMKAAAAGWFALLCKPLHLLRRLAPSFAQSRQPEAACDLAGRVCGGPAHSPVCLQLFLQLHSSTSAWQRNVNIVM
jgi:hypothetical protein